MKALLMSGAGQPYICKEATKGLQCYHCGFLREAVCQQIFLRGKKTKILFIRKDSHQLSVLRLGSFIQHTGFATNTALKNKSLKYKFFPVFSFRIWTKDRLLCMIYSIYLDVNHWCRSPNRIFFFFFCIWGRPYIPFSTLFSSFSCLIRECQSLHCYDVFGLPQ